MNRSTCRQLAGWRCVALVGSPSLPNDAVVRLLVWGGLGIALLVVFVVGLIWVRRRLFGSNAAGAGDMLDLETLRQLREAGTISEQEYKALRGLAIQALDGPSKKGLQR